MQTYAEHEAAPTGGENSAEIMRGIENNSETIAKAFSHFFLSVRAVTHNLRRIGDVDLLRKGINGGKLGELEKHQITLLKDVSMLDKMYEENLLYFKQLTMYILAGKKKLETERATTLPALVRKAEQSGLPEDAQKARDFADMCTRFEKKIYDLELTRNISIQMDTADST